MSRWLWTILVLTLSTVGCGDDDEASTGSPRAEIDTQLTLTELVGGDLQVITAIEACEGTPPARLRFGDSILTETAAIEPLSVLSDGGDGTFVASDERTRFLLTISSDTLRAANFGLPIEVSAVAEVDCPDGVASSDPVVLRYVPTDVAVSPPERPTRFWASDTPGDLLLCIDSSLIELQGGVDERSRFDLGFPCSLGELTGVLGERRYLWSQRFGVAAVGVGPSLVWSRSMLVEALWSNADENPVVLRSNPGSSGEKALYVLDFETGDDVLGPIEPSEGRTFLDAVSRLPSGEILVLEAERVSTPARLTYFVRRLSSEGEDIGPLEAATYNYDAPLDIASFSFDGRSLFFKDAPNDPDEQRIAALDTTSGETRLLSTFNDPWRFPLADAFGRLLVASEDSFAWLDPETGERDSEVFAPESGNSFLRLRVETDGSTVMIADATANSAQGLYVFAPDGSSVLRFTSERASFSWLAVGWEDETLLSYFNEVHVIPNRAEYASSLETQ
ncbi:MAG: hypothetical protein AAGJ56_07825 [Myxococcota bacterium]